MKTQTILTVAILSLTFAACTFSPTDPGWGAEALGGGDYPAPPDGTYVTFQGTVIDSASNPVPGVKVNSVGFGTWPTIRTTTDGTFSVDFFCRSSWNGSSVIFERVAVRRTVVIPGAFCQDRTININDWPTS